VKTTQILVAAVALGIGLLASGCKSAPDLSKSDAAQMVQAYYSAQQVSNLNIIVNNDGMVKGALDKYWARTTVYPNRYWADFKLTPEGKKLFKLADGSDTIKWRPDSPADSKFRVTLTTIAPKHPKAHDFGDVESVGDTTRTVPFIESVDFAGVPQPVQDLAHMPGNLLSAKRTADFALENGAWKVQSVE
jgi:hypothetical protein